MKIIFAFLTLKFFSFLNRFKKVVIVHFPTCSIGRLLPDFEEFFCQYYEEISTRKTLVFSWFDKVQTNLLISKYIKFRTYLLPNSLMTAAFNLAQKRNRYKELNLFYVQPHGHFYPFSMKGNRLFKYDFENFLLQQKIEFPSKSFMSNPYATLCVRERRDLSIGDDLRNTDIDKFHGVISFLISQGIAVARMTREATTPISLRTNLLLDYPFELWKSDYADLVLFKEAKFCLSTGFGADHYSSFWQIPVMNLNSPLMATYLRREKSHNLPKVFIDINTKRVLSVDEIIYRNLHIIEKDYQLEYESVVTVDNTTDDMIKAINKFISCGYYMMENAEINSELSKKMSEARYKYLSKMVPSKYQSLMSEKYLIHLTSFSDFWPNIYMPDEIWKN